MADWLTTFNGWLGPEAGLWGLFAYSFLAATLLPGGSEIAFFAYLRAAPEQAALALTLVTIGNTLGGLSSYAAGRFLPKWQRLDRLPHAERVRRLGSPALLLAWAPLIGDLLCVAAGWLRLNWLACTLFMAAGKLGRYWLIALTALP
jgi:membrane protein YqaA with SNARE-associated domain